MKRLFLLLALLLVFAYGWSQTMTINFKNGSTHKYNMSEIEFVEFSQDQNNVIDNVSIVGVWECTQYDFETNYPEMFDDIGLGVGQIIHFESDGTCYTSDETGKWIQNGSILTMVQNAPYAIPVNYNIRKLTSTELEITGDIGICKVFCKLKRIS